MACYFAHASGIAIANDTNALRPRLRRRGVRGRGFRGGFAVAVAAALARRRSRDAGAGLEGFLRRHRNRRRLVQGRQGRGRRRRFRRLRSHASTTTSCSACAFPPATIPGSFPAAAYRGFDFAETSVKVGYEMGRLTPYVVTGVGAGQTDQFRRRPRQPRRFAQRRCSPVPARCKRWGRSASASTTPSPTTPCRPRSERQQRRPVRRRRAVRPLTASASGERRDCLRRRGAIRHRRRSSKTRIPCRL